MATPSPATFAQLLEHAVNEPGILSSAYRQFYGYSLGNQLLAMAQCLARGIQPETHRALGDTELRLLWEFGRWDFLTGRSGRAADRLVANVSDGGQDCRRHNNNNRLDTRAIQQWVDDAVKAQGER